MKYDNDGSKTLNKMCILIGCFVIQVLVLIYTKTLTNSTDRRSRSDQFNNPTCVTPPYPPPGKKVPGFTSISKTAQTELKSADFRESAEDSHSCVIADSAESKATINLALYPQRKT